MRYVSLAFVFVNIPFEIACKGTHIFAIGKKCAMSQKVCTFADVKKIH